ERLGLGRYALRETPRVLIGWYRCHEEKAHSMAAKLIVQALHSCEGGTRPRTVCGPDGDDVRSANQAVRSYSPPVDQLYFEPGRQFTNQWQRRRRVYDPRISGCRDDPGLRALCNRGR